MENYGVTDKGFVLKRMDEIAEEVHEDLTEGFGFDTRLVRPSFLDTLITSFCGQISDLWEVAQESYYAKYPATATGVNLDNAVQYGGIRRAPNKKTCYPLHCTGDDGTTVREDTEVATNTMPQIKLSAADDFEITRESFNSVLITVASAEVGIYSITINGERYSYTSDSSEENEILEGLKNAINDVTYSVSVSENCLSIKDTVIERSNVLILSDNLTTSQVTTIANFLTKDYGKITLPYGVVSKIVNNITGFTSVTNLVSPTLGRTQETDIELRQSYIAKSALRSNTMIDSITSELLNNVSGVETASGYENDTDVYNERGLPPHSIEIIVEGGNEAEIASAILKRKAGGIQTFGSHTIEVPGKYGDQIPIHFNRPEYLYTWIKVVLHGDKLKIPSNYASLVIESIVEDGSAFKAGDSLLMQLFTEGIYDVIAGLTYVEIYTAYSTDNTYIPKDDEYKTQNVIADTRQKVLVDERRIGVTLDGDN